MVEAEKQSDDGAVQGKVVGIIYPPPDIRGIVDKTAQFVAKNGKGFEARIMGAESGNKKFSFLVEDDPYHAYYDFKVNEFMEKLAAPEEEEVTKEEEVKDATVEEEIVEAGTTVSTTVSKRPVPLNSIAKAARAMPEGEPPKFEFLLVHPHVSALDSDIIKLTAQYTAVSGRQFLTQLAQREQRNPQFDFLKPTHALFGYFTALVDSYVKVLRPAPELRVRLAASRAGGVGGPGKTAALFRAVHRHEYERAAEAEKKAAREEADAERAAYQSVDWHDFVVVEVIHFDDDEAPPEDAQLGGGAGAGVEADMDMPAGAVGPMAAGAGAAGGAGGAGGGDMDMDMDMEMEMEEEEETKVAPPPPVPAPPVSAPLPPQDLDPEIKVVTSYDPEAALAAQYAVKAGPAMRLCPRCNRQIPEAEMEEHMRIELLDPRWREENARRLAKQKETAFAAGSAISDNLKRLARKREDIFASSEEEEQALLRRQEEDKRRAKVLWDGHSASREQARQQQRDIAASQPRQQQSTVPNIGPSGPGSAPRMPPPPASAPPPPPAAAAAPPAPVGGPPPPQAMRPAMQMPMQMQMQMPMQLPMPGMPMQGGPMGMGMGMPMMPPGAGAPPGMGMAGMMPPPPGAPPAAAAAAGGVDGGAEPEQKRARTDNNGGLSEAEFIARHPTPITVHIRIPVEPSTEWKLEGQTITLHCDVRTPIKDLKEQLKSQIGDMPASKQQLRGAAGFLKDSASLAFYNIGPGCTLEMSARQRGGRR